MDTSSGRPSSGRRKESSRWPRKSRVGRRFQGGMKFDGQVSGRAGTSVGRRLRAARASRSAAITPMELLLAGLAGCSGQVTVGLLKRMGQEVKDLTVHAQGAKKEDPSRPSSPRSSSSSSSAAGQLDAASVEKALALSEERYCPVWAMLKAAAPIKATYRLLAE
ncbi:MAG: OsmC family protein [Marinilabiliales bacterium]|nr:OsmC family protein [Marinilabiliales bacterium]